MIKLLTMNIRTVLSVDIIDVRVGLFNGDNILIAIGEQIENNLRVCESLNCQISIICLQFGIKV